MLNRLLGVGVVILALTSASVYATQSWTTMVSGRALPSRVLQSNTVGGAGGSGLAVEALRMLAVFGDAVHRSRLATDLDSLNKTLPEGEHHYHATFEGGRYLGLSRYDPTEPQLFDPDKVYERYAFTVRRPQLIALSTAHGKDSSDPLVALYRERLKLAGYNLIKTESGGHLDLVALDRHTHSTRVTRYSDGRLKSWSEYSKGDSPVKDGLSLTFWKSGAAKSTGFYSRGVRSGVWEEFTNEGLPVSVGQFKKGKKHGRWLTFHRLDSGAGRVKQDADFLDGELDGLAFLYDKHGNLERRATFAGGKKHGLEYTFSWTPGKDDDPRHAGQGGQVLSIHRSGNHSNGKKNGEWIKIWSPGTQKEEVHRTSWMNGEELK